MRSYSFSMILCGFIGVTSFLGFFTPRNSSELIIKTRSALTDWDYYNIDFDIFQIDGVTFYKKESMNRETVLLYGDSHVEQYAPRLVKIINDNPESAKSVVFATSGGCPPIRNIYEDKHPECNANFKSVVENYVLNNKNIESVVIGASWRYLMPGSAKKTDKYKYYCLSNGEKK